MEQYTIYALIIATLTGGAFFKGVAKGEGDTTEKLTKVIVELNLEHERRIVSKNEDIALLKIEVNDIKQQFIDFEEKTSIEIKKQKDKYNKISEELKYINIEYNTKILNFTKENVNLKKSLSNKEQEILKIALPKKYQDWLNK